MALELQNLDCLALRKASEIRSFLAFGVAFMNSFRMVVRRGVHPGLDLAEGREQGAEASIRVVRTDRAEENHEVSWLGEGVIGGVETSS